MTTKNIYIFGHGNQALNAADLILSIPNFNLCGYFEIIDDSINFYSVDHILSENINLNEYIIDTNFFCIAIGLNFNRQKIYNFLSINYPKIKWTSIISNNAKIKSNVFIGNGTIVHDNVYINRGTKIGNNCIVNNNSSIDHDCLMDDFSSIAPAVVFGGNVSIGSLSHIGISTVILQNTSIGICTVVGAKSLVNTVCESNSLYYGSPIKFIKKISNDFNYLK
jgi:sugar O-acyltransferase (sialic acid O-acetyltransferase NeuD family)